MIEIDPKITIEDLVEKYPAAVKFLSKRGIVCIVCGEPAWGTLEEMARKKGVEDVEKLAVELSDFLNEAEQKGELERRF